MIIVATLMSAFRPAPGVPYDSPGIAGGVPQIPRSNEYPAGLLLRTEMPKLLTGGLLVRMNDVEGLSAHLNEFRKRLDVAWRHRTGIAGRTRVQTSV